MSRLAPGFLILVIAGCTSPLVIGQECTDTADCEDGLSCVNTDTTMTTALCMADCDIAMTRICTGGEVCIPVAGRTEGACHLGGPTPVGSPCTDFFECATGAICVTVGMEQNCRRACDTSDGSACQMTETCEGLTGMGTNGFCQPM